MKDKYNEDKESIIYEDWRNSESYMEKKGFTVCMPEWVKMYEGDQWGPIKKGTEGLPRPIINFTEMIIENKKSNILGSPANLNFIPDDSDAKVDGLSKFAQYQLKEMGMNVLDRQACLDGLVKGTYVYHLYFDENAIGKRSKYKGAVRCEIIDPLNVRVSNPCEQDCQKQKWIIIRSREEKKKIISIVKELKLGEEYEKLIEEDTNDTTYDKEVEQSGSSLVTVYTKYFKKDGEVYYERATKNVVLGDARPISPLVNKRIIKEKLLKEKDVADAQVSNSQDMTLSTKREKNEQLKFHLYPIEIGSLKSRDKCIYGRSEVENLAPNQRIVNSVMGLVAYSVQNLGMPATVVKPGFLNGQKITTKPGAVYTDYSNSPNGWGIMRVEGQQVNNGIVEFGNALMQLTRTVSNATEVLTGEVLGSDMSGTAIAQLQAQNRKPIDDMQKRFWASKEKIGKILELYYKLFYQDYKYSVHLSAGERMALQRESNQEFVPEYQTDVFNGSDYIDSNYNIIVEAGQGTQYSEIMAIDTLNKMFGNRALIDLSADLQEQYISLCPDSVMPFKSEYKEVVKEQQMREKAKIERENQEYRQALLEAKETLERLGIQFKALKDEFTNKTNIYNENLAKMQEFMKSQKNFTNNLQIGDIGDNPSQ